MFVFPSLRMIGEKFPPTASVYCRSSPVVRSSVQMLRMLPFFATSGSSGTAGSVAADEKTIVLLSTNCAPVSSCVPNVICVFFFASKS